MASGRLSKVKGKVVDIPTVPTIGTATAGNESATVAFTASTKGGPVSTYTALSNPGSVTGSGTSSPVTVSGLTGGTAYTFTVRGNNATGSSEYSSASNSITALVPGVYESISTTTLGSSQATITFSSIPATFKHLQLRISVKNTRTVQDTASVFCQVNSDTSNANYTYHNLQGSGSTASASGLATGNYAGLVAESPSTTSTSVFGVMIYDFIDYTNTNKYKTIRHMSGYDANGNGGIYLTSNLWLNTNAISTITVTVPAYSFAQYSKFSLYGIKG
jgi:hypothetical protein